MSEFDLGYAVGIFDGEGTVTYSFRKNNSLVLKIAAYNTDVNVLKPLQSIFGGPIYEAMDKRPRNKPKISMWHCPVDKHIFFCEKVSVLTKEKEKQEKLNLMLNYLKIRKSHNGRLTHDVISERKEYVQQFNNITKKYRIVS